MTDQPSILRRIGRFVWRVTKWGTLALGVTLTSSGLYARVLRSRDLTRWRAPGRIVAVDQERRMHLYCTGTGTPIAVLEAGLGDFSLSAWQSVQPQIAQVTRVCSYDRAGTGWSDAPRETPTATGVVHDLHALLQASGETGPYVLVGHSLGGPFVRHYATHYPDEVAGLVMVDGSHEDQIERMRWMPQWTQSADKLMNAVHVLGLNRLLGGVGVDSMKQLTAALTSSSKAQTNSVTVFKQLKAIMTEVKESARPFGDLPLVVLTAGVMPVPGVEPAAHDSLLSEWRAMGRDIASRSARGRWVLAERSAHYIQRDDPELVIKTVREMVESVRASRDALPRASEGSLPLSSSVR